MLFGAHNGNRPAAWLAVLPALLVSLTGAARGQDTAAWTIMRGGMNHAYNLEYDEGIAEYQKALKREPENVRFLTLLANAYLFRELHRLGQLDASLYSSSNRFLKTKKIKPDEKEITRFRETLKRVRELTKPRIEANPKDTEALYALGVAQGLDATLMLTVEKKFFAALRAATRSNKLHEKVLKLDPEFHDAKLITGTYQYVVGSLPWTVKLLAFFIGHRGNKEKGLKMLAEAMERGTVVNTDAAVVLALGYGREKRFSEARELLEKLSASYTRNHVYATEIGRSYQAERKLEEAVRAYQSVLQRREDGAPGFADAPADRLAFEIGELQQRLGKREEALESYGLVTGEGKDGRLVLAHARLRRGQILLKLKRKEEAREEFEQVARMPYPKPRQKARRRLRRLRR